MNRPKTPSTRSADPVARWALAGVAFAVAAFMMTFYVQLLHESVTRGAQWRYSQSTANTVAEAATNTSVRLIGAGAGAE